jgi:hypothetical protein
LERLVKDLMPRTTAEYTFRGMRLPEPANPRSTMGVLSRTSLVSLRQARFVSGSIFPSTLGCLPYFTAILRPPPIKSFERRMSSLG